MKSLTEFLYGKEMKKAVESFDAELKIIENSNKVFFEENELELRKSYILEFNNRFVRLSITDKKVDAELGVKLKNSFKNCFKKLSEK